MRRKGKGNSPLFKVVRDGLSDRMGSEQGPERSEGMCHLNIWGGTYLAEQQVQRA